MQILRRASSWRGYIGLSLIWLAVLAVALLLNRKPSAQPIEILPPPTPGHTATPEPSPTARPLRIDIAGAVRTPGVYTLPPGSIVADAIAAAGGTTLDAAPNLVNKATPLQDGMQVYVPHSEPATLGLLANPVVLATAQVPAISAMTPAAPANLAQTVNLNSATAAELDALPGIGSVLAQRIIDGRPYGGVEDLLRVEGIGPEKYEKLKNRITVR